MFHINNVYHGFKLIEETKINEIDSIARIFEHVKSGARLLHIENKDDNKVFSISFRTIPHDSTGVAHILEHAVLCGSRKFRTKDTFADMAKSSLNTFLNAMTGCENTTYPISSRNHKDFFNLMDVYLDSVLYPNIYENHELLRQEGWRYEIDEQTRDLVYKGIVYNEMKGALASPEKVLILNILSSLFPNTVYEMNSGGDPYEIPNLTQEEFENFHRKFYHPSNSYIYLYGDEDLDKCLQFINDEYLKDFDKTEVDSYIKDTKPFEKMVENILEYSINEEDVDNNKTFMALNFACGETKDMDMYITMCILSNMLIESPSSPIRKALLNAEIGESMLDFDYLCDIAKKTILSVAVNNANEDDKEEFKKIIFDTFSSLVNNGIDKKLIEASINSFEFKLREAEPWVSGNKGITHNLSVIGSWLYDGHPLSHLIYEEKLNRIKKQMNNNYFENFIEKNILNNNNCSLVILKPKKGLDKIKLRDLELKLQNYKETLSEDDIKNLKVRNEKLKKAQMKENTEAEIATLPKLSLNDISKEIEKIPQVVSEKEGVRILSHNINTNKIEYINLLFDANIIEEKDIHYLGLLRDILGKLDTLDKSYSNLNTEILRKTGGITFETDVYSEVKNSNKYHSKFIIQSKVLCENIEELVKLIYEIITSTKFDNEKRIKEIIQETKAKLKIYILNYGNEIAMNRAASYFSKENKYKDMVNGIDYYKFLCDLEKNLNEKYDEVKQSLTKVYRRIFNKNNLIVSYTGEQEHLKDLTSKLHIIVDNISCEKIEPVNITLNALNDVEGIITSTTVQYVAKAFNYKELGYNYSGKMRVLQNVLDSEYLYTRVRLQGGAYGCYMHLDDNGNIYFASYRDPNLDETIKTYNEANNFLEEVDYNSRDIEKFIIGAIGNLDKPLSPQGKGERATKNYVCGTSNEDIQRERDELLSTSLKDVKSFRKMIKKGMEENYCCIIGNEMKINDNRDIFNKITILS